MRPVVLRGTVVAMSNPAERRGGWPVTVAQGLQALLIAVPGVKMLALGWPALGSTDKYGAEFARLLVVSSCVPLLASVFGLYLAFAFRGGNLRARHYIVLYEATVVLVTLVLTFLSARPHFWSVNDQGRRGVSGRPMLSGRRTTSGS